MTQPPLILTERVGAAWTVTLNRPDRHNALTAELIEALRAAIADRPDDAAALVLTGSGRSFSTGGDIGRFRAEAESADGLAAYADRTVGGLHAAVMDLLACPVPVIARVNGPVTGGALGLVLAADLVAMAEDAFLQPYYVDIGFAPDGGWTALLPERIGPARAAGLQLLNRRTSAAEAQRWGLATALAPRADLDRLVADWVAALAGKERDSLHTTRRLIWDDARRAAVGHRLEAERQAFVALVGRPEVRRRMDDFLANLKKPARQSA